MYLEAIGHHWAITDALVALTKKPMDEFPVKLKELFMELRGYNYFTSHIAGSRNIIADTLSRTVHWTPKEEGTDEEEWSKIEQGFARQVTGDKHSFLWKDPLMKEVTQQVQVDKDYMSVLELVKSKRDKAYIKTKVKSDHPVKAYLNVSVSATA